MATNEHKSGDQGFASMDEGKQRDIASQGGKASHESGRGHEFTSEEASDASRNRDQSNDDEE